MDQKTMGDESIDNPAENPIKWGIQRRLEFIDFRLLWDGRFNRKDLSDIFSISAQQASADIALYEKAAPHNLEYDKTLKAYVRHPAFKPRYIGEFADRYLLQLVGIVSGFISKEDTWFDALPPAETVILNRKKTNSGHLLAILDAIRNKLELSIDYQSMSGKPSTQRNIMPHALAHSAGRWHTRAWCREYNEFRDFNLNRILHVTASKYSIDRSACDMEWNESIDLILAPNPDLSTEKQLAVGMEYNMTDGQVLIPTRLSLSFYLIHEYNLDMPVGSIKPDKQQLVLLNYDDVIDAKMLARQATVELLKQEKYHD